MPIPSQSPVGATSLGQEPVSCVAGWGTLLCCVIFSSLLFSLIHRNEFRAWTDIKPVKPIKAKPQYKPPDDKTVHETSYSAQFKGEVNKPTAADNKATDRRRIRSLYSEPFKESPKVRQPLLYSLEEAECGAPASPPGASSESYLSSSAHRPGARLQQAPLLSAKGHIRKGHKNHLHIRFCV